MGTEYVCYRCLVVWFQLTRFYFTVVLVTALYYDFVAMALQGSHTEASLVELGELGYQFSQSIKNSLLAPLHNEWNFPKFHQLMCHLLSLIREIGHPHTVSSAPFEHKHQPFKQDYSLSNNNGRRGQSIMRTELRY
jgi:hypothetical protein